MSAHKMTRLLHQDKPRSNKHFLGSCLCGLLIISLAISCSVQPTEKNSATNNKKFQVKHPKEAPSISPTLDALINESLNNNPSAQMRYLADQIRTNPTNPDLIYALGYEHMEAADSGKNKTQHDLAIRYFTEALKLVPGNTVLLRALYNIYYEDTARNRNPNAFESARSIFFQLPESARKNLNPPSLAKYVITAAWFENQHKINRPVLRRLLLDALQEQPSSETVYILLAKQYSDEKYYSMALATLKLGAENIPKNTELLSAIAETYEQRQDANGCSYDHPVDIQGAAKYYKLAIAQSSDDKNLHYGLSRALLDQNLTQLALNEANIILELNTSADSLSATAERYSMLGQFAQAQKLLQQAVDKGYKISDPGYHEMMMNQGDWKNAYKGFSAYAKTRESFSVYDLIKNDIIAQQAHQPTLALDKKLVFNSAWEEKLHDYWNKKLSDSELKSIAKNSCERTEYNFYTGYQDFTAGKTNLAKTKFTEAINQNTYRFIERPLARYFLTR